MYKYKFEIIMIYLFIYFLFSSGHQGCIYLMKNALKIAMFQFKLNFFSV